MTGRSSGGAASGSLELHGDGLDDWALRPKMGGLATLRSYGVVGDGHGEIERQAHRVPDAHRRWLAALALVGDLEVMGDRYWLIHAGLPAHVSLAGPRADRARDAPRGKGRPGRTRCASRPGRLRRCPPGGSVPLLVGATTATGMARWPGPSQGSPSSTNTACVDRAVRDHALVRDAAVEIHIPTHGAPAIRAISRGRRPEPILRWP